MRHLQALAVHGMHGVERCPVADRRHVREVVVHRAELLDAEAAGLARDLIKALRPVVPQVLLESLALHLAAPDASDQGLHAESLPRSSRAGSGTSSPRLSESDRGDY